MSGPLPTGDRIDVDFAVPFRHRLRFTRDLFGAAGGFGTDGEVLRELLESGGDGAARVLVYVDDGVIAADRDVAGRIAATLAGPGVELVGEINSVPGGEASKNDFTVVDRVLADVDRFGLDRRSYVLAVGGGAMLDAVGYAAAVAHRGVRLVRVPTTTVGQGDSGVGVKNAVNAFGQKNWRGTFAVPWGVVNDAAVLRTLPDRDFAAGFSEAVKVALLKDADLFATLVRDAAAISDRRPAAYEPILRRSVLWHLRHVTGADPYEAREARPLDFGHWAAHRLETLTGYDLRHGEAVAIGLAIDVTYSAAVLGLSDSVRDEVVATLRRLGLPTTHRLLDDPEPLLTGLEDFRRHLGGRLTVTLLRGVADPVDVHEIDLAAMRAAIATCVKNSSNE